MNLTQNERFVISHKMLKYFLLAPIFMGLKIASAQDFEFWYF